MKKATTKRVTLKDIAAKAKVSHMTVSLALRKHPKIPQATRSRIEKIAQQMGYRPNPYLNVLMSHLRSGTEASYQASVALLDFASATIWNSKQPSFRLALLKGAREKAKTLGFNIEHVRASDSQLDMRRFQKNCYNRNVNAFLIMPNATTSAAVKKLNQFDFQSVASVTVGYQRMVQPLHFAENDQFQSAQLAHLKLLELGYRRILFISEETIDRQVNHRFTYGFLSAREINGKGRKLPIFKYQKDDSSGLGQALKKHKPDAILTDGKASLIGKIRKLGIKIPDDIALASLDIELTDAIPDLSGIRQNHDQVAAAAVEKLVSQINLNEYGIPEHPQGILIEGKWVQGSTTPAV